MCYKSLWDSLAATSFSSRQFYDSLSLNPHYMLSEEIRENTANSGFPAKVENYFHPEIIIILYV